MGEGDRGPTEEIKLDALMKELFPRAPPPIDNTAELWDASIEIMETCDYETMRVRNGGPLPRDASSRYKNVDVRTLPILRASRKEMARREAEELRYQEIKAALREFLAVSGVKLGHAPTSKSKAASTPASKHASVTFSSAGFAVGSSAERCNEEDDVGCTTNVTPSDSSSVKREQEGGGGGASNVWAGTSRKPASASSTPSSASVNPSSEHKPRGPTLPD